MDNNDIKMTAQVGSPPVYTSGVYPGPPGSQVHVVSNAPTATVIHAPGAIVPVVVGQKMGAQPATFTCKSCNEVIVTRVESNATLKTHLFAGLLCLFGCWLCVCIPYCVDSCKNADHYCPNCNAYIGSSGN